jgi:hypothetical protein
LGEKAWKQNKNKESWFTGKGNVSASVGSLKVGDIQAESGKRKAEKADKKRYNALYSCTIKWNIK